VKIGVRKLGVLIRGQKLGNGEKECGEQDNLPDSDPHSPLPNAAKPHPHSLLQVRDLQIDFTVLRGREHINVQAVRGVSFELQKGECLGIVGESGSGKSVSTLAIPGLLPQNASVSGSILYNGNELIQLPAAALREYRGKKIGMIFQEPGR
jgi:peptide/nickel transport system permease protein